MELNTVNANGVTGFERVLVDFRPAYRSAAPVLDGPVLDAPRDLHVSVQSSVMEPNAWHPMTDRHATPTCTTKQGRTADFGGTFIAKQNRPGSRSCSPPV